MFISLILKKIYVQSSQFAILHVFKSELKLLTLQCAARGQSA